VGHGLHLAPPHGLPPPHVRDAQVLIWIHAAHILLRKAEGGSSVVCFIPSAQARYEGKCCNLGTHKIDMPRPADVRKSRGSTATSRERPMAGELWNAMMTVCA